MNNTTYTPQHIANFFLSQKNHNIDNLKLNKLLYISWGWISALTGREIFHEPIQAWRFGPVIPSVYHEFKKFGYDKINELSKIYQIWFDEKDSVHTPKIDKKDTELLSMMKRIYSQYHSFTANQLVQMTHAEGTPWKECYQEDNFNVEISKEKIKNYYKKLIDK